MQFHGYFSGKRRHPIAQEEWFTVGVNHSFMVVDRNPPSSTSANAVRYPLCKSYPSSTLPYATCLLGIFLDIYVMLFPFSPRLTYLSNISRKNAPVLCCTLRTQPPLQIVPHQSCCLSSTPYRLTSAMSNTVYSSKALVRATRF